MTIANILTSLREQSHLSQEELASILHVNRMTYHYYESGSHHPPLEIMYRLAVHYQVSLDELYDRKQKFHEPAIPLCKLPPVNSISFQEKPLEIVGNRLHLLRSARALRQEDVASALGISRSAYSYYETGRRQPSPSKLILLVDFYQVSLDWLCGRF